MGMIGGGIGSFIGAVHRIAANMDGQIELVCGALSSREDVAKESGKLLFLSDDRIYSSYEQMILEEAKLPEDKRMDFVSIVTPNFAHFAPAMLALENGFHVAIDKPITLSLDEAKKLEAKLAETGLKLLLTYTYAGYPMVKQAKELIQKGQLGKIRKVYVEYIQGWLSRPSENEGNAQAAWRTDPKRSGPSGCMGDIGTHAINLAEYVSGLETTELCAMLNTVVDGRQLDDDGMVLLKFDNGATGMLTATQIAAGEENNLTLRIYGEKGGIEWHQMEPNTLIVKWADKPAEILRAGSGNIGLYPIASDNCRTPAGHPEGYLEAFANHYRNFVLDIKGEKLNNTTPEYPSIKEGVHGMAFIENVIRSSQDNQKWTKFLM
ncbi:MAG: oxidoreductase [Pseudopedobacter saltans]|uniref:Oxidoreductase n=1 Tax=Pseudopedobacter saltans TaxID=151895 RepID=A0A2W5F1S8_9SPHI|nr:MAG: oxidoreductase [Pseudopedobacter saltans]